MNVEVPAWSEARRRLVSVLRRATDPPMALRAGRLDPPSRLVRRPLVPFVHEVLALDLDEVRVLVARGHLDGWGIGEEAAFQVAHANLASLATMGLKPRPEYGLWQVDAGDGYETSRLGLPGWLPAFAAQVGGRPVAIAPANRVLLVGSDAPASVERLLALADGVFRRADARLSPVPLTVDAGGRLAELALPAGHPSEGALAAARALLAAHEYEAQREQLADAEDDARPAPVALVDDGTRTEARWDEGEALLPRADRVRLVDARGRETVVAFADLERLAGRCLVATELDPPRFRASWPSEEILRAMGSP